jgi:hypothetical protein
VVDPSIGWFEEVKKIRATHDVYLMLDKWGRTNMLAKEMLPSAEQDILSYYLQLKKKNLPISLAETTLLWMCNGKGEEFRKKWLSPRPRHLLN